MPLGWCRGPQVLKKLKRRFVGGGAWRAFLHRRFSGQRGGRPDIKAAAVDYHAMLTNQDPAHAHDHSIGVAAKMFATMKQSHQRGSNFGPDRRSLQRTVNRQARVSFWHRTKQLPPQARSSALAVQADFQGKGLGAVVALARDQHRQDKQVKARQHELDLSVLESFETGPGQECIDKIAKIMPALNLNKHTVTPVPTTLGVCFDLHPPDSRRVCKGLAWAGATQKTNLAIHLEQQWIEHHKTVEHNQCMPIASVPSTLGDCVLAGRCVCNGAGLTLMTMRNSLQKHMKSYFKFNPDKASLRDGNVVVQLRVSPGQHDHAHNVADVWLHVAAMYFSPYRPTYHELRPFEGPDLCGDASAGRVLLEVMLLEQLPQIAVPLCVCMCVFFLSVGSV